MFLFFLVCFVSVFGCRGGGFGGGSGGGSVKIAHRGTFTNNGTINVAGGDAGIYFDGGNNQYNGEGGDGGDGTYTALQVQ